MDGSRNTRIINGNTNKLTNTKSKTNRATTTTEHSPGGLLHRTNHGVGALNIISNNKRFFWEITFSPKVQKIYIFSCNPSVYKMSFVLRNPFPHQIQMDDKVVVVVIQRTKQTQEIEVSPHQHHLTVEESPHHQQIMRTLMETQLEETMQTKEIVQLETTIKSLTTH